MGDYENLPGPNPSTLETVDYVPEGIMPVALRVTYSTDSVTDYVNLKRSGRQCTLELGDPLFGIVRKAGEINDLIGELTDALAAIGLGSIVSHFSSAVAEYFNSLLHVPALPGTIGLSTVVYVLKKMYDADLLMLGYIHQAPIEELPSWLGLLDEADRNPEITLD
ncbi:hypothetical protein ACFFQF_20950 [Haladaptatus pallidirubidus]|uniref:Uncharacterized protein n=1 Tax=Haladaptatus pallidirubidus TaxID=1008152 RepID=A0AAV3UH75_9EURY|nr:hypothetical protein [Haladaptatus pallidirubidus]